MADVAFLITHFVSAAIMLTMAGWLLWLKFGSAVNRSFAVVLLVSAGQKIASRFANIAESNRLIEYWSVIATYMFMLFFFALINFALVYLRPKGLRWYRMGLLAISVAAVFSYMLNHCIGECTTTEGQTLLGPLSLIIYGGPLIGSVVGLAIATSLHMGKRDGLPLASSLVASAFALDALFFGTLAIAVLPQQAVFAAQTVSNVFQGVPYWAYAVAVVPATLCIGLILLDMRRQAAIGNQGMVLGVTALIAIASGMFVGLVTADVGEGWSLLWSGLWSVVPSVFIVYALLQHRIIGLDERAKAAVKSSAVAAFFAAAFFIGSELIESFIDLPGLILGIAAAAAVSLALKPIQWLAQRFADKAFPQVRPVVELTRDEREEIFRDQVQLVWADGVVAQREREVLDRWIEKLEIPSREAARLEAEIASKMPISD